MIFETLLKSEVHAYRCEVTLLKGLFCESTEEGGFAY